MQSESAWIKRRRASTDAVPLKPVREIEEDATAGGALAWNPLLEREELFQKGKLGRRKVEAYLDGTLLPTEVDPGLDALATIYQRSLAKNAAIRDAKAAKARRVLQGDPVSLKHQRIFFEDQALGAELKDIVAACRARAVPSRADASLMIVADPAMPSRRVQ